MAKKNFFPKDSKYKSLPKSAKPRSPNEPDEYEDHSYNHREIKPDGTTIYYYDNGVKAIHHPKNTSSGYHRKAAQHHQKQANTLMDKEKTDKALSHLKARIGHRLAMKKKKNSSVEKLYKDFGGAGSGAGNIVAVASDPGIFTETYSGTDSKKKKKNSKKEIEENKKRKKKASGPDKLDKWLEDTQEKTLDLVSLTKTKYHLGRTGGLTPDASIKTPDEERDMEEFMEARTKNAENRAFGIKETKDGNLKVDESIHLSKTDRFSNYVANILNDVRIQLNKEDDEVVTQEMYDADMLEQAESLNRFIDASREFNKDFKANPSKYGVTVRPKIKKMETDWSKDKKDGKLNNMPFLGSYKKSIEGRRENPPPQVEKQYGAKRSPRPDKNGYRNPPNRRIPDPEI
tara:strand:- start:427 stop:1629 length:1203 start_codon:yes stop_codon:yes gene_type:complete